MKQNLAVQAIPERLSTAWQSASEGIAKWTSDYGEQTFTFTGTLI